MNRIEGQGEGAIFDAKWGGAGALAACDAHGHLLLLGVGAGAPLMARLPAELFFHTDYRPLLRDAAGQALDEQVARCCWAGAGRRTGGCSAPALRGACASKPCTGIATCGAPLSVCTRPLPAILRRRTLCTITAPCSGLLCAGSFKCS